MEIKLNTDCFFSKKQLPEANAAVWEGKWIPVIAKTDIELSDYEKADWPRYFDPKILRTPAFKMGEMASIGMQSQKDRKL